MSEWLVKVIIRACERSPEIRNHVLSALADGVERVPVADLLLELIEAEHPSIITDRVFPKIVQGFDPIRTQEIDGAGWADAADRLENPPL